MYNVSKLLGVGRVQDRDSKVNSQYLNALSAKDEHIRLSIMAEVEGDFFERYIAEYNGG